MKSKTTQIGLIAVLLVLIVALSGCSSTESDETQKQTDEKDNNAAPKQTSPDESEGISAKIEPVDATITISGGKVEPAEITIPINSAKIRMKNMEGTTQRISMPFYGASVDTDIAPGEEKVVTVSPTYPGRVSIELNGARLGGVTVVES